MSSGREIKRRIRSAKNISQITRAMQMVAASKMKKATDKALAGKAYADKIYEMTTSFAAQTDPRNHPLLQKSAAEKQLILLMSTNKGLCGGLNNNLFRMMHREYPHTDTVDVVTIGKKGKGFCHRLKYSIVADFSEIAPFTHAVPAISKFVIDGFLQHTYGTVVILYSDFESALKYTPRIRTVLPITMFEKTDLVSHDADKQTSPQSRDLQVEPSLDAVLQSLLTSYIETQIRASIIESEASEHSARMIAMKNATDSAHDLTDGLTLAYNKIRQQAITSELLDMVTARSAVT